MKLAFIVVFAYAVVTTSTALAEESKKHPEIPAPSLNPQFFKIPGKYFWHRAPEVKFVLVTGCGGGGKGGDATLRNLSNGETVVINGNGGGAAPLQTITFPVDADKYEITVGASGHATSISWAGGNITFPRGNDGGATGLDGEASVFGKGGTYGSWKRNPLVPSTPGIANCSGGGSVDYQSLPYIFRSGQLSPSHGAPGYLSITPIPDLDRFARTLALIEKLTKPTTEAGSSNTASSETALSPSK